MSASRTTLSAGGTLSATAGGGGARLELTRRPGGSSTELELTTGELLMVIEALSLVYGELCGAHPGSVARGVNRTLRNRTAAARQRRQAAAKDGGGA